MKDEYIKSIIGTKINDWEILSFSHKEKSNIYLLVKCKCGKILKRRIDHIIKGTSKSCHDCAAERTKTGDILICSNPNCKKEVYKTKSTIRNNKNKKFYCNKRCGAEHRSIIANSDKNKICPNCNKSFHIGPKSLKQYCSRECWAKYIRSNGPVYYRKLREDKCFKCDFTPIDVCQLDVHHIDKCNKNNSPENLVTLCANCHRLVTKINNKRKKNGLKYLTSEEILNL